MAKHLSTVCSWMCVLCAIALAAESGIPTVCAQPCGTGTWELRSTTGPSAREGHAMAYDSRRSVAVLFGGSSGSGHIGNGETWEWDGVAWSLRASDGPPPRRGHAMAYDSARGVVVLFGGVNFPGGPLADTWEWDGAEWTMRPSKGPRARYNTAMVFDSVRNKTVLFGGAIFSNQNAGDTWEWDGAKWVAHIPSAGWPIPVDSHAMAFDASRGVTVLYGGAEQLGKPDLTDQLREWDGTNWKWYWAPEPGPRGGHAMAFDQITRMTVLFGGSGPTSAGYYPSDTWEWAGAWAQRSLIGPGPRLRGAMVYDAARGRCVAFGGSVWDGQTAVPLGDTWEWHSPGIPVAAPLPSSVWAWNGSSVTLSVSAAGAAPLSYQWRRNSVPLANGGAISGAQTDILRIDPLQSMHAGSYDVVVVSPCGTVTSTPSSVSVRCYADCDGDGSLTVADFSCFQNRYASGTLAADCNFDAMLTVADFGCFQTKFVTGCP